MESKLDNFQKKKKNCSLLILLIRIAFIPRTNMVRMIHRNLSTIGIAKFEIQQVSYGRKLICWRVKNTKTQFWGPELDF